MKETIVRCDVCKQIIKNHNKEGIGRAVVIDVPDHHGYLNKYCNTKGYRTDLEVGEEGEWIDWSDVCPTCRRHLAKRLPEAINEIWKEG